MEKPTCVALPFCLMLVPCLFTESVGNFACVRSARRSLTAGA